VYDLEAVLEKEAGVAAVALSAGAEEKNPAWRAVVVEKPWTERHPEVLWGVLGAAVLGLGYLSVRFLLKVRKPA
jgi:hypothetical protein